jgi:dTDP-4-dehydrorhamnose 3,5-epimerase
MIKGVSLIPLQQIQDERGKVMHMLRVTDPHFENFGEIYFSCTYPGVVKGWHKHNEMTLNYAAVKGAVKVVLFDDRVSSPTKGEVQEIYLTQENYYLLVVPPLIWNGFKAIGTKEVIVANCATIPHSAGEIERLAHDDPYIPYDWGLVHK